MTTETRPKTVERHADYLEITDSDLAAARSAWRMIAPRLPRLIDAFYAHLGTTAFADIMAGHDIERLKHRQTTYWEQLFNGRVDGEFVATSARIAATHKRVGVPLSAHLGAYGWFNERLFSIVVRHGEARNTHAMITAVNKLIFLDVMIATDAYTTGNDPAFL